jgi:hypothetical protein
MKTQGLGDRRLGQSGSPSASRACASGSRATSVRAQLSAAVVVSWPAMSRVVSSSRSSRSDSGSACSCCARRSSDRMSPRSPRSAASRRLGTPRPRCHFRGEDVLAAGDDEVVDAALGAARKLGEGAPASLTARPSSGYEWRLSRGLKPLLPPARERSLPAIDRVPRVALHCRGPVHRCRRTLKRAPGMRAPRSSRRSRARRKGTVPRNLTRERRARDPRWTSPWLFGPGSPTTSPTGGQV